MTKNEKQIITIIKKNLEKTNVEIAGIVQQELEPTVSVETLRKKISAIRSANNLNQKESLVSIEGTQLKLHKTEYLKNKLDYEKVVNDNQKLRQENDFLLSELKLSNSKSFLLEELNKHEKVNYNLNLVSTTLGDEATAFWIGSDWHIEETVEPSTVNGMNEYNIAIAKDSIQRFFKNALKLTDICKKDIVINNVVLGLLGDHITGYIHDELVESNSLSPTEATMVAIDLISSGIKHVLDNSTYNFTVVCKDGNHGRTTLKKRISTEYKNSYEWMMYHMIAREFKDNERIKFVIDKSYMSYLTVYDKVIRFHHGDYIKYQGGVGGLTIPANKAISQWDKERVAYLDVFGHYHQLMLDTGSSSKFVMNGSIIGYNAYALSIKASYEEPKQAFFLIDKHRGKTISAPIFVR